MHEDDCKREFHEAISPLLKGLEQNRDQQTLDFKEAEMPFICLGKSGDKYVYYSRMSDSRIELKPGEHSKLNLITLASEAWWAEKLGEKWTVTDAAGYCFGQQGRKHYSPDKIRGVGFWREKNAIIYNAGDRCFTIESGKIIETSNIREEGTIYQRSESLPHPETIPMSDEEGQAIIDYLNSFAWREEMGGLLLSGFLAQGITAGFIDTRAHVWINAPACTGKTFLVSRLKDLLGNYSLSFTGGTSEAGIRQKIGSGARLVLLDEMEAANQDKYSRQKVEKIMSLVRRATDGETSIIGSKESIPIEFRARSSFLLLSIGNSLQRTADKSRFINLHIRPNKGLESFEKRDDAANKLAGISPGKLIARMMSLASVMKTNANLIQQKLSAHPALAGRRAELLGNILAGAYALTRAGIISEPEIDTYTAAMNTGSLDENQETDAERCLREILESRVVGNSETVGQAILSNLHADFASERQDAKKLLDGIGISVYRPQGGNGSSQMLFISAQNRQLSNILQGTDWANCWGDVLRNHPEASWLSEKRVRNSKHKGVAIPIEAVKSLLEFDLSTESQNGDMKET